MAFTAAVEWDVRTTGSDSNGGGFAVGSGGTDYSQQDAPQATLTDLVIDGTTNTDCTSAARPFTAADVGNIINITSGTGFTVQRVQIISIQSGNKARCDKSLGTLSSTGGNGRLGGSLLTPGAAAALMVAGNTLHIQAGTYTITSASNNVAGGCVRIPSSGTTTLTSVIGYQTTHRDYGTQPLLQASGISTFVMVRGAGAATMIANISVDGAGLTSSRGFGSTISFLFKCKAANCTNNGINVSSGKIVLCEATGCSTATSAIDCGGGSYVVGCTAYANTTAGFNNPLAAEHCLSVNNSGGTSHGFMTTQGLTFNGCVAYGNGGDGFSFTPGSTSNPTLMNCLASGNAGWQFGLASANDNATLIKCAAKADGSGAFDSDFAARNLVNCITLTADPFTNAAGGDFSLNGVAGGGDACKGGGDASRLAGLLGAFPGAPTINTRGYQDIGAVQTPLPGLIF